MRNGPRANGPRNFDRGVRRSVSGRLSPPVRGGAGRGRPGFTVEGGVGSFGPSQAVEGRTMKSYNDLDAAVGGGSGGGGGAGSAQGGGGLDY